MEKESIKISIDVDLVHDGRNYIISSNDKSEKYIGASIVSTGKTVEEAERKFWVMAEMITKYHSKRSDELDKWKLFQKSDGFQRGVGWFTILGIKFYIRHGRQNKGGWFVPLTDINIMVINHWRENKVKTKVQENTTSDGKN